MSYLLSDLAKELLVRVIDNTDLASLTSINDCCILEVDISPNETQVYLIDIRRSALLVLSSYWAEAQLAIAKNALAGIQVTVEALPKITRNTVLLGTWHFGHLIGDHAENLVKADRMAKRDKRFRNLHASLPVEKIRWLFDSLWIDPSLMWANSHKRYQAEKTIRVFLLDDCDYAFPASDIDKCLSISSCHVRQYLRAHPFPKPIYPKVYLTAQRSSRVLNTDSLCTTLLENGWYILNPLKTNARVLQSLVSTADLLVSDNGSILFNCFLAREKPYYVLSSARTHVAQHGLFWEGGGKYNNFHRGLINYVRSNAYVQSHHPYSDQIEIDAGLLLNLRPL